LLEEGDTTVTNFLDLIRGMFDADSDSANESGNSIKFYFLLSFSTGNFLLISVAFVTVNFQFSLWPLLLH